MVHSKPSFRDLGILPHELKAPDGAIRAYVTRGRIIGQFIFTGVLTAGGLTLVAIYAATGPWPHTAVGTAAALVATAAILYLAMRRDFRWIELDGNTLRAGRLYTGGTVERSVPDIQSVRTIYLAGGRIETTVLKAIFGRIRGVEIYFRDGRDSLRVYRTDPAMVHAQELIEGVLFRMTQLGELEVEMAEVQRQPLVKSIHWRGEVPRPASTVRLTLVSLTIGALSLGAMFAYWFAQQEDRMLVGARPPQAMTVAELIRSGPGQNRHVTLTDFTPGECWVETKGGSWSSVWLPLFPQGMPAGEIEVIFGSTTVPNEAALNALFAAGRVTCVCSRERVAGWGVTLGPNLVRLNGDRPLNSAWRVDDMRVVPSASFVEGLNVGSLACFATVFLLAAGIVWKAN